MSEREKILGRIRDALRTPAPMPGAGHHGTTAAPRHASSEARSWLPHVGSDPQLWRDLFSKNSAELKTTFLTCQDEPAAIGLVCEIATREGWQRIASHGYKLAARVAGALKLEHLATDHGYDVRELEACQAGITECDALIAQTGSILLTSRSAGGRALSILPPHHIVLARREQLVPDLPAAYSLIAQKYGTHFPSMISLVTGPSRTGDIERILVLGAHGPEKLTVILLEN